MKEVFGFPSVSFACDVANMHVSRGTPCKLYKQDGVWYVAI